MGVKKKRPLVLPGCSGFINKVVLNSSFLFSSENRYVFLYSCVLTVVTPGYVSWQSNQIFIPKPENSVWLRGGAWELPACCKPTSPAFHLHLFRTLSEAVHLKL